MAGEIKEVGGVVDTVGMHGVPPTDPAWAAVADAPPRPIIAEPESAAAEPAPEKKTVMVVVWLIVSVGVMWAALPVAFITAVAIYGWEQAGLVEPGDGLALPIAIASAVYLGMSVMPIAAGRLAFPLRKAAMTVVGLLTPAVGIAAAWLFYS